jgi:uncharacterized membrane protein YgdD (TMEM256/DUF423 family)
MFSAPAARLKLAALMGASAVACGGFGAHALKATLGASALMTWQTGVLYHLIHALAVLALAALPVHRGIGRIALVWALGTALFSGSLYALALTGWGWLGPITPIGGALFVGGWLGLGLCANATFSSR